MEELHELVKRQNGSITSSSNDPNIGSGRNVSTSAFLSTLIVNFVIFAAMVLIFIILRRSNRRIYAPRTYVGVIERWRRLKTRDDDSDEFADEVEGVGGFSGYLGWIKGVWKIPDETVLRTNGLDGFFFLRYLRLSQLICFVGCCITFPVLFPVNATGGAGQEGLDMLSLSNLGSNTQNRLYAHVFVGYIFFGFVLFTIYRELVFFTTMKQAYMLSPIYSTRISARTLLVTTIPDGYLNETALRRIFDNVKRVWINTDTEELEEAVKEREEVAFKLEAAEVSLIKLADAARLKSGDLAPETVEEGEVEGESGSVAARWLDRKKRPTHKLKFLIGEKVDTIDWCRGRLGELNSKIAELQAAQRNGEAEKLNSAFIEFTSQSAAQVGLQILAHNQPLHMAPRYIGITPADIVWSNMKLLWWERLVKFAGTTAFVTALVIFWSIPVAVVGTISQITYLTQKVPFLKFINDIPSSVLGVITGLLPSVMLAVLMALLPIILRLMSKISGLPSFSQIELRTQNMYFCFQVIQVFLITTMTSAASSAIQGILKDPSSAPRVLAESLPKASNFYISFMILQGLAISAGSLLQIVGLVLYKILGMFLDNTPRKMWARWSSLSGLGWGTVFPIYTNLCVIAITYSVIAPLVMGFAVVGFGLLYYAYRYNFLFVYDVNIDTKGMVYPRALYQTLTGVYLAEICLIGLFAIRTAFGPLVLQIIFLIFTVLFQMTLTSAIQPLLEYLPKNLETEEEQLLSVEDGSSRNEPRVKGVEDPAPKKSSDVVDAEREQEQTALFASNQLLPTPSTIARFLHPEKYESFAALRKAIPKDFPEIVYTPEEERDAYLNPAIKAVAPVLWIPRDGAGISRQEVAHTQSVIGISDEGAFVENGKIVWTEGAMPPDWKEKIPY
ncbi:phosphate metabolism protein 7 [Rhizina undulata]